MKRASIILGLALSAFVSAGQEETITIEDVVQSADEWARQNLDDDALRALQGVDRDKVRALFRELEKQFHGQYVVDMAGVNDAARAILPLLQQAEETKPYADWLKTRLDYLEVAEQIRKSAPPAQPQPGQPARPVPNPTAEKEREIWTKKLADRPWPAAAKPYVAGLKPIFTAQKVPSELIWMAEVESSFNPQARSPVGAAGLFQLMPATAKRFGLRTMLPDERLQAESSARAAAKYLGYLHGHFKDWRLAVAAYNAGEGTVQKLLDRHKARSFDAIATHLPAETQMYVPKVEATIARREGVQLSRL